MWDGIYQEFDGFQGSQTAGSVQGRVAFAAQAVDVVAVHSAAQDQVVQFREILPPHSFDQRLADLLGDIFGRRWRRR